MPCLLPTPWSPPEASGESFAPASSPVEPRAPEAGPEAGARLCPARCLSREDASCPLCPGGNSLMSRPFSSTACPYPSIFPMETRRKGPGTPGAGPLLPRRHSGPASAVAAPTQPGPWVRHWLVRLLISPGRAGPPPPGRKRRWACVSQEMKGAADAANPGAWGAWLGSIFPAVDESQLHACPVLVLRMQDPREPQVHSQKPVLGRVPSRRSPSVTWARHPRLGSLPRSGRRAEVLCFGLPRSPFPKLPTARDPPVPSPAPSPRWRL